MEKKRVWPGSSGEPSGTDITYRGGIGSMAGMLEMLEILDVEDVEDVALAISTSLRSSVCALYQ